MFYSLVVRVWQKIDILYSQSLFSAVDRGYWCDGVEERGHREMRGRQREKEREKRGNAA
jgi:hypothetical protein